MAKHYKIMAKLYKKIKIESVDDLPEKKDGI